MGTHRGREQAADTRLQECCSICQLETFMSQRGLLEGVQITVEWEIIQQETHFVESIFSSAPE